MYFQQDRYSSLTYDLTLFQKDEQYMNEIFKRYH